MKKITPLFTRIVTTADVYEEIDAVNNAGIIDPKMLGTIKGVQRVISIGQSVRFVKPGDLISLNFARYTVHKVKRVNSLDSDINEEQYKNNSSYQIPLVTINDESCLFVDEGDVDLIINEYEEEEIDINMSGIVQVDSSITPSGIILN